MMALRKKYIKKETGNEKKKKKKKIREPDEEG